VPGLQMPTRLYSGSYLAHQVTSAVSQNSPPGRLHPIHGLLPTSSIEISKVTATPKQTVISKQKIGWGLVALAFVLVLILVRYATLYWLEVLAVPIMGLVALGLTWALSE